MNELVFTIAATDDEFRQIEELNHETFTSEIPQHAPRPGGRLRDAFHTENTYLICRDGSVVVGMLALRGRRPFSLDRKLPGLDALLPEHSYPCEIRLLAVRARRRKGRVAAGLLALAAKTLLRWGHDLVVVSATTRELSFYRSMGFVDFGPLVGSADAPYQPMHLTYNAFVTVLRPRLERLFPRAFLEPINFLPGPPTLSSVVRGALAAPPLHHRSPEALDHLRTTQALLCEMTQARHVQITSGSGTSANDQVAHALRSVPGSGLVVSNGEFGERLADQAKRAGLDHTHLHFAWGDTLDLQEMSRAAGRRHDLAWLWCVHGETSTGVLNPLPQLEEFCERHGLLLCLDAVSTVGVASVNLSKTYLATGVSGKGLGAVPGLALLFHNGLPEFNPNAPLSLDPHRVAASAGVPNTVSSMLMAALRAAVQELDIEARVSEVAMANASLREWLPSVGLHPLSGPEDSFDAAVTIPLPAEIDSKRLGTVLERAGFSVAYHSSYLRERNWIQVCFMSRGATEHVSALIGAFADTLECGVGIAGAA